MGDLVANCPDPKLITEPKTFASQKISGIFPTQAISVEHGKLGAIWIGNWGKDRSALSFDNILE